MDKKYGGAVFGSTLDELKAIAPHAKTVDGVRFEGDTRKVSAILTMAGVGAELVADLATLTAQIDWLQKVNTLHRQVDILYVVDGYEVTISWDDHPISEGFHGESVSEAISKAMAGFDLDAHHPYQDRDIYGHERQMAALAAQRDELLAALESFIQHYEQHQKPLTDAEKIDNDLEWFEAVDYARAAIAKAEGGAA